MIYNELIKRILSSIILFGLVVYIFFTGDFYLNFFVIICFLISTYEWIKMTKKIEHQILGLFFLSFSFYTFYEISLSQYLIFVFLVCISTDIGGYIFGKLIKGPKLTKISPNKTYSGMIGGYILSLIFLAFYILITPTILNTNLFITTILISTVSQIGDIIISYFKRLSNIKDTGKIIPGHGGLLDRIDGMIFAFPFFYLIMLIDTYLQ